MYNDFKPHLVKKGETVSGIAKQYGVLEDDLINTNRNISLTQSPGGWFTSFKWVASVKEGDTLRIPFYNQDKTKKGVKAISGKTSVKPGEWEEYTVTEWYGGTPLEDRNEDCVKWELYLLQPGKAPEKVLEKATGSFRFMEKAAGERFKVVGYLYQPELNNASALTVTVVPTQKREIQSILLKDTQGQPISGPLSYGQKLNVYVSATGMAGEDIHLALWEGDAKGDRHSQQNEVNPNLVTEASTRVSEYGVASCTFLIKPDFAKMAKAHMSSGDSKQEYYVTAYADDHTEGAPIDILNVYNPASEPATRQIRQQKAKQHLAERKAPKRNATIPPFKKRVAVKQKAVSQPAPTIPQPTPGTQPEVSDVLIRDSKGQAITDALTGSKIRLYIYSTGLKGKKVKMSLYEDDVFDQLLLDRYINLSGDKHLEEIAIADISKSLGDDWFEGDEQELFVQIEVPQLKGIIESQTIEVDIKSFKPDKPDGVSVTVVEVADGKKEEKKEEKEVDFDMKLELVKDNKTLVPLGIADFGGKAENKALKFKIIISGKGVNQWQFDIKDGSGSIYTLYSATGELDEVTVTGQKSNNAAQNNGPANQSKEPKRYWPAGEYTIEWDGFDKNGIYKSKRFLENNLVASIKGKGDGKEKYFELKPLQFERSEVDFVDVVIDRIGKRIDATLRVNLQDGGAKGLECVEETIPNYDFPMSRTVCTWDKIPKEDLEKLKHPIIKERTKTFEELKQLALEGLSDHWGRNKKRKEGQNVVIDGSEYEMYVITENTNRNTISSPKIVYITNEKPGRSRNWEASRILYYNVGYIEVSDWYKLFTTDWRWRRPEIADEMFKETAAHEIGHEILLAYGGHNYSKTHKDTSNLLQQENAGLKYPKGEIDLMKYYHEEYLPDFDRVIASERDALSMIWLTKITIK